MALVVLRPHGAITLSHEKAVHLDKVMRGVERGTPKQRAFARRVRKIYFSKLHKPQSRPEVALPDNPYWQR